MNIPILCISLLRAHERRKQINELWIKGKQCDIQFIDAVDRRDIVSGEVSYPRVKSRLRELTAGEIACSLSHAKAIYFARKKKYAKCIIIEDDAVPLFATPTELNQIINYHDQEFPQSNIALLHAPAKKSVCVKKHIEKHFSLLSRAPWGTYGYLVKCDEYDRLHDLFASPSCPSDWYWNNIYAKEDAITIVNTPLVAHQSKTTYIGNEFRAEKRVFLK